MAGNYSPKTHHRREQPGAVRFYERSGYHRIPLFAPYHVLPQSNCFARNLH
ncbi:hypothetical protein [Nocardia sp. A7]|uniref:hypothetical protein n=1 Tax=Nocardia sp. A7 TaxID=2789274 RepID=UPI00397BA1A4